MSISPSDAAVAARSFPRRWRALFAMAEGDDEHSDVLERSGALDMAREAADTLAQLAERLPAAMPPEIRASGDVLDRIAADSDRLARVIDAVPADEWVGRPIETLTEGIDKVASLLRSAQRAIDDAR